MLYADVFRLLDAGYSVKFEEASPGDPYEVTATRGLRYATGTSDNLDKALRIAADSVLGANNLEVNLNQGE